MARWILKAKPIPEHDPLAPLRAVSPTSWDTERARVLSKGSQHHGITPRQRRQALDKQLLYHLPRDMDKDHHEAMRDRISLKRRHYNLMCQDLVQRALTHPKHPLTEKAQVAFTKMREGLIAYPFSVVTGAQLKWLTSFVSPIPCRKPGCDQPALVYVWILSYCKQHQHLLEGALDSYRRVMQSEVKSRATATYLTDRERTQARNSQFRRTKSRKRR